MDVELLDDRGEQCAMKKSQNVVMKGTKDGLTLQLNDRCSYEDLLEELKEKLLLDHQDKDSPLISVKIQTGNRYLTDQQIDQIKKLICSQKNLVVDEVSMNVVTIEEAMRWKQESEITSIVSIVRSGQIIEVPGDLLLVGDVNPGGMVMAGGNIFIMGSLKGIAHAGCYGNDEAVIVASKMVPTQLRISTCLNRAPDEYSEDESHDMECAYINESNQIVVDRLQVLKHLRPNITRFKGGQ
jgi:septum site-determining protein MinC